MDRLWDCYPGDCLSRVCSLFFLFCWVVVCATAWLSLHKLKDVFQSLIISIAAITWTPLVLNLLLHGFAPLFINSQTDDHIQVVTRRTNSMMERKPWNVQLINRLIVCIMFSFYFDLGTWKISLTAMISSSKIFWSWRTCFPQLGSEPTFFFYFYTFNYLRVLYCGWEEVKGQPAGVVFFFLSIVFLRTNFRLSV